MDVGSVPAEQPARQYDSWWQSRATMFVFFVMGFVFILGQSNFWLGNSYSLKLLFESVALNKIVTLPDGFFFMNPLPAVLGAMLGGLHVVSLLAGIVYFGYVIAFVQKEPSYLVLAFLPVIQVFAFYQDVYALVYLFMVATYYHSTYGSEGKTNVMGVMALLSNVVLAAPVLFLFSKGKRIKALVVYALYLLFIAMAFSTRTENVVGDLTGPYGLFSPQHMLEWVTLLGCGAIWMVLSSWVSFKDSNIGFEMLQPKFWAMVLAFILSFFPMVHLGILRDWASLSVFMIPLACYLIWRGVKVSWYGLVLSAMVSLGWVFFNSHDRQEYMQDYMFGMPQYTASFNNGKTRAAATVIMLNELSDTSAARRMLVNGDPPPPPVQTPKDTSKVPTAPAPVQESK